MVLFLLFCGLLSPEHGDIHIVKRFDMPEDELLMDPHFMDFSPDGELYVVERNHCRIMHWDKDGAFLGSFAEKGEGPGELIRPELVHVTEDAVWVYGRGNGRFSVFDRQGKFVRSFPAPVSAIRRFAVVNPDLLLIVHQVRRKQPYMAFELIDTKGTIVRRLKQIDNHFFINGLQGDNLGEFKAYGPESDIYSDKAGTIWFGFSETNVLYRLDQQGKIVEEKHLDIPTSKPTDQEVDDVNNISLPGPGGRPLRLSDLPGIKFRFDFDKAIYTHFNIVGDTLQAVLVPSSGNDIHKGYHIASYSLVDFATGKTHGVGRYRLPEDSCVIYANGRAIAFIPNEEDDLEVAEIQLPGRKR